MANELVSILRLLWSSPHHSKNTKDFIGYIKSIILEERECNTYYNVITLFISVPVNPVTNITKDKLE